MIVLVDAASAKEGYEFIYIGASEECDGCRKRLSCHANLEEGRRYRVISAKEATHACPIFGEVAVCEVDEAGIDVFIDSGLAFQEASLRYQKPTCKHISCTHWGLCLPEGLNDGDACIVKEVKEKFRCEYRGELVLATLKRA